MLSVPAIKFSVVVKSKKKWWKQTRLTIKPIGKRKCVHHQRCSKEKINARKKEVFILKEAQLIQEKRGSTDKRISVEEEVSRTICLLQPKRNRRKATFHFIIVFFETNPELKYKKGRRIAPTKPTRKSRSNRQPYQVIHIKDSSAKKQSRKGEEQIESEGKRVARELCGKSKYNLHNARQMRYCLCRNGSQ